MEFRLGKTQDLDSICLLIKDAIVKMEKNGIYQWDDFVTLDIEAIKACPTYSLYDLQGRRLTQQPRKGVYIRDGQKVMVK